MKQKKQTNKKGFSFIEVMISMFLITMGLMAVLTLLFRETSNLIDSRNQVMAGFLAQEGAELARNFRDTNWENDLYAFDSSTFPAGNSVNCVVSLLSTNLKTCGVNLETMKLYYTPTGVGTSAFYLHNATGKATKFKRKLNIIYDTGLASSANSASVMSIVVWGDDFPDLSSIDNCNSKNKCAYSKSILTKWKG